MGARLGVAENRGETDVLEEEEALYPSRTPWGLPRTGLPPQPVL